MRIAVVDGRACVIDGAEFIDIFQSSHGRFGPDAASLYDRWSEFRAWAALPETLDAPRRPLSADTPYGAPSPRPRQVFGIGVNYADHAAEANLAAPSAPLVFTKFPSCIVGAAQNLELTVPTVDWEAELVVVMGATTRAISRDQAWDRVAGLTVGQDISDRTLQMAGVAPQFSLAKSRPGYGPIGPSLVTPDELRNPDDLEISCTLNGEVVQHSRTSHLIHDVPALVAYLSTAVTLFPGDLIFTGTPAGVGFTRRPPRYLAPGDHLVTSIAGVGELHTRVTGAA